MSVAAEGRRSPPRRVLGFWLCLALVMGNLIGSGVYLLPTSLAHYRWNAVFGWVFTVGGARCLAFVFSRLAPAFPQAGGVYGFVRAGFRASAGILTGFHYMVYGG